MIIIMTISMGAAAGALSYYKFQASMTDLYVTTADNTCALISEKINWDKIDVWLTMTEDEAFTDPEYVDTLDLMRALSKYNNLTYLLVFKADELGEHYIFDADTSSEHWELGHLYKWEEEDLPEDVETALRHGKTEIPIFTEIAHMSSRSKVLSVIHGYKGSDGETKAYIATCFSLEHLAFLQREYLVGLFILIAIVATVFCWLYSFWVRRQLIAPIKDLANSTEQYMRTEIDDSTVGDISFAESDLNETRNELSQLRITIDSMQNTIHHYIGSLNLANKKASTDALTGIYNREVLIANVDTFLGKGYADRHACSFIMIDIDRFKQINDTYGHSEGDIVLKQMGALLTTLFRPNESRSGDVVARFGGDEFAVFCRNFGDTALIDEKMRIFAELLWNIKPGGHENGLTASVGIATALNLDQTVDQISYSRLYMEADKALYAVKEAGRNGFKIINL
ncbi:GGDEF domain-containing protein [Lachnospiraceae bacterium ZAX-1]